MKTTKQRLTELLADNDVLRVENALLRRLAAAVYREAAAIHGIKERFDLQRYALANKREQQRIRTRFRAAADQLQAAQRDIETAMLEWLTYESGGAA